MAKRNPWPEAPNPFASLTEVLGELAVLPDQMARLEAMVAEIRRPAKLLYTVEEAAQALSLSPRTVYHLIDRGDLSVRKINSSTRIRVEELERFAQGG